MITVKCDVCGKESNRKGWHRRYSYVEINERTIGGFSRHIHLCDGCRRKLETIILKAVAEFIGVEEVRNWEECEEAL